MRTPLIWIKILLGTLLSLSHARGDTARPLNAGGEPGEPLPAEEIVRRIKRLLPELEDRYHQIKSNADYQAFLASTEWKQLRAETARLRNFDLESLRSPQEKTAFWLNVYNILVKDGILALRVRGSVQRSIGFFDRAAYQIGGYRFSLEIIEHGLLRDNRLPISALRPTLTASDPRLRFGVSGVDPRIHFALNCGARSCPPIQFYSAEKLEAQLDAATRNFVRGPDVRVEPAKKRVALSQIFRWYAADFGADRRDVLRFLTRFVDDETKQYLQENLNAVSISYLPYDWSLDRRN
jgi:hypothetical protein